MPRYGRIDREYAMRLAGTEPSDDGPVYMLNLMKYREVADYELEATDAVSGREADDRYAPVDVLRSIGAWICFSAEVVQSSEDWDRVAVVRYPTRRSFIEMQSRRDFQAKHVHKDAGMDHTIVVGTLPDSALPAPASPDGLVLLELWDGPEPSTPEDGAAFTVEGTIVGDGRTWTGAHYGAVPATETLPAGSESHQALLVRPTLQRWS